MERTARGPLREDEVRELALDVALRIIEIGEQDESIGEAPEDQREHHRERDDEDTRDDGRDRREREVLRAGDLRQIC